MGAPGTPMCRATFRRAMRISWAGPTIAQSLSARARDPERRQPAEFREPPSFDDSLECVYNAAELSGLQRPATVYVRRRSCGTGHDALAVRSEWASPGR